MNHDDRVKEILKEWNIEKYLTEDWKERNDIPLSDEDSLKFNVKFMGLCYQFGDAAYNGDHERARDLRGQLEMLKVLLGDKRI